MVLTRKEERLKLAEWAADHKANYAVTLNFNREMSDGNARKALGALLKRMDEYQTGHGRANQLASEDRLFAIAVPEHRCSNYHFHMALALERHHLANRGGEKSWKTFINQSWSAVTRGSGTSLMTKCSDLTGWVRYLTKEGRYGEPVEYLFAAEFHPDSALGKKGYASLEILT